MAVAINIKRIFYNFSKSKQKWEFLKNLKSLL